MIVAGHWLKYLGFENAPEICVNKEIDLNNLLLVKDAKFFIEAGFDQESSHQLWQIIEKYKKFSSVEGLLTFFVTFFFLN